MTITKEVTPVARMNISMPEKDREQLLAMKIKLHNAGIKVSLSKLAVRGMKNELWQQITEGRARIERQINDLDIEFETDRATLISRLAGLGGDSGERRR